MGSIQMKLSAAAVSPGCEVQLYATTGNSFPRKDCLSAPVKRGSIAAFRIEHIMRFEDRLGPTY